MREMKSTCRLDHPGWSRVFLMHLIVILIPLRGTAQLLPFETYTQQDGLSSNTVWALHQDSRGYLWIGTSEGLTRYDGVSFERIGAREGLSHDIVSSIASHPSSPEILWVGTLGGGLNRIWGRKATPIPLDSAKASKHVFSLLVDRQGMVWCGTAAGVFVVGQETIRPVLPINDRILSMKLAQNDSLIWIAINNRLFRAEDGESPSLFMVLPEAVGVVEDFVTDGAGHLWVLTQEGFLLGYSDKTLFEKRNLGTRNPAYLLFDNEENLWIGGRDGLLSMDVSDRGSTSPLRFTSANGLPEARTKCGLSDREGILWFGGFSQGLHKLESAHDFRFPIKGIPGSYNNSRAVADAAGRFWVASQEGLWEIFSKRGRWGKILHAADVGLAGREIHSLVLDRQQRLWVDTKEDLRCYELGPSSSRGSRLKQRYFIQYDEWGIPPPLVLMVDSRSRIWMSIHDVGVFLIDLKEPRKIRRIIGTPDGLPNMSIRVLYEDRRGNMWFGGFTGGLAVLAAGEQPDGRLTTYSQENGLPNDRIRAVLEDHTGKLWVGTRYGGLASYAGKEFDDFSHRDIRLPHLFVPALSVDNGLLSNAVWSLAADSSGTLWIGTGLGLERVDAGNVLEVHPEKILGSSVNSCGVSPDGLVWFVTSSDFHIFRPRVQPLFSVAPVVHFTNLEVNSISRDIESASSLTSNENNVSIEFIGVLFRSQRRVHYQYRLLGSEQEWRSPTQERSVTYAALEPGDYVFEVRAVDDRGRASGAPARLALNILPPFWKTWWFLIGAGGGMVFTVVVLVRRRIQGLRREQDVQQEFSRELIQSQEQERKRIAGELHDGIGQNLLAIKNRADIGVTDISSNDSEERALEEIASIASESIKEVREIAYDLRPFQLDRLGFTKALESIVSRMSETSGVMFTSQIDEIDGIFTKEMESHVYRIMQEGINNIVKHSQASEAKIHISRKGKEVHLSISDNGRGFDSSQQHRGLGLIGLRERSKLVGGTLRIDSRAGEGTTLHVRIPYER